MKRIIALMLVIGCAFACVSCGLFPSNEKEDDNSEGIAAIQTALDASAPDSADISVVFNSSLGTLNGEYNVIYNDDGSAEVTYSYELFNSFEEDSVSDEIKSTYTGVTAIAPDGTVVDELGGVASVEAVSFEINLDAAKLDSVQVSKNTLGAKVLAANTASVLGVAIGYDADLVISIGTNGVSSVAISYTTDSGVIEIVSVYTYIVEEEPAEGEEGTEDGSEEGSGDVA